MGFARLSTEFLVQAKAQGTSFGRTLTLGRQSMFISPIDLARLLKKYRCFPPGILDEDFYKAQFSSPYYGDELLRVLGAVSVSAMDMTAYEGASILHDLNKPVPEQLVEQFDTVIDSGTLEHVFNFPVAIKSCMQMLKVGGTLFIITPVNNFFGHGFYQFSAELFYRVLGEANGFTVERMYLAENEIFFGWIAGRAIPVEYLGAVYSVPDPADMKERINLASKRPVQMMIQAKRVARREIFEETPQQSDYQVVWNQQNAVTKLQYTDKWAKLKHVQLHWLPMLFRSTPLFFTRALRRRSLANHKHFKPVRSKLNEDRLQS